MKRSLFMAVSLFVAALLLSSCANFDTGIQKPGDEIPVTPAASVSPLATMAPSASPEETMRYNLDNIYSVMVPRGWQIDDSRYSDPAMVLFVPPIEVEGKIPTAYFTVTFYDTLEGADFSAWFLDLISESVSNIDMISENIEKSKGVEFYRYEFTGTYETDGLPMHFIYCYLVKGSGIYQEAYAAEPGMWAEYSPIFEKMISSFEALSSPDVSPNDFPDDFPDYSPVIPPDASPDQGPTEESYGYITGAYSQNGKNYIDIDYADVLTGDAAIRRAIENGAQIDQNGNLIWPGGEAVNIDWYVVNSNPKIRTFELAKNCSIQIFGATQMLDVSFLEFQERLADFGYDYDNNRQTYMFVWIDVQDGLVVSIEEYGD